MAEMGLLAEKVAPVAPGEVQEWADLTAAVATVATVVTLEMVVEVVTAAMLRLVWQVTAAVAAVAVSLVSQVIRRQVHPVQQVAMGAMVALVATAEVPVREEPTVTVVTAARRATAPTDLMVVQPLWQLLEMRAAPVEPEVLSVMAVMPERDWVTQERQALSV